MKRYSKYIITGILFVFSFQLFAQDDNIFLPEPTGPYKVGTTDLFLKDTTRLEIKKSHGKNHRELYIKAWYPADKVTDSLRTQYLPPYGVANMKRNYMWIDATKDYFRNLRKAKTNSFRDVQVSGSEDKYPVLIFSHGYGIGVVEFYHSIMENLASHGYIIMGIVHPYESVEIIYPDGRTTEGKNLMNLLKFNRKLKGYRKTDKKTTAVEDKMALIEEAGKTAKFINNSQKTWVADSKFLVDQLEKSAETDLFSILKGKIDLTRIGAIGHSFGGSVTGQFCREDKRLKLGVNLDGWQFGESWDQGLLCPFFMIGAEASKWYDLFYKDTKEDYYSMYFPGSKHFTYTDLSVLPDIPDATKEKYLSSVDSYPDLEKTNKLILDFLNHYLKGSPLELIGKNKINFENK